MKALNQHEAILVNRAQVREVEVESDRLLGPLWQVPHQVLVPLGAPRVGPPNRFPLSTNDFTELVRVVPIDRDARDHDGPVHEPGEGLSGCDDRGQGGSRAIFLERVPAVDAEIDLGGGEVARRREGVCPAAVERRERGGAPEGRRERGRVGNVGLVRWYAMRSERVSLELRRVREASRTGGGARRTGTARWRRARSRGRGAWSKRWQS